MKKRKGISFILLAVLTMAILAGCGKSDKETNADVAEVKETKVAEESKVAEETKDIVTESTSTEEPATEADQSNIPTGHVADTVQIGYVDVSGSGILSDTLGVARDQGFIEEEFNAIGVKAELVPMTGAGPAINEALASSNLDIGFLGDVPAIIGKAAGIDTQLISFSGLNNGASLVVTKGAGYTSVTDLKGKKIATQKGAYMHKVLIDILTDNGLTIKDIEFINLNAQGAAEAFISGNVDGVVVGGSTLSNLVEGGYGDVLVDYREHPEWNCGSYGIARTKFVDENPDIIYALIKALVKAQQLAKTDTDVMLNQWVTTGNTASSYEYLYPEHDNYFTINATEENIASGKSTLQFLLDNELVANSFAFEDWINSTFYEAAYAELGISE